MYDQVSELIGHEFIKYIIEQKFGVLSKPVTLVNPTSNAMSERINQVMGNLVLTYNIK